jgi:uncharacterized protein YndB with AHSA1/START domain
VQAFAVQARSKASPQEVWRLLTDTSTWPSWTFPDEAVLEQEGSSEREGVGAIRRFRTRGRITRERVVVFEPPTRFGYELLSGIPIKDYRAEVLLKPDDGGTVIEWRSAFRGQFPLPPRWVKPRLERIVRMTAEELAHAAESGSE